MRGIFCTGRVAAWLLLLLLAWGMPGVACAEGLPTRRLVVLIVPDLRDDDLVRPELPTLRRVIGEGRSGWMLCRAARVTDTRLLRGDGRDTDASLLLTLGSGTRAIAGPEIDTLTGSDTSRAAFALLKERNAGLDHPVPVGTLGSLVHRSGMATALIGNADADTPDRAACALAMDADGRIDFARLQRSRDDAGAPYGFRADLSAMQADYAELEPKAGLIVVVFGDLARADRYAPRCLPSIAAAHRRNALRALERLLLFLVTRIQRDPLAVNRGVQLCVLSPGPAASSTDQEDRCAPFVQWGEGIAPGWTASASTRWPGLLLNTDFLAIAANFFQQALPPGATGRLVSSAPVPGSQTPTPELLRGLHESLLRTARLQHFPGALPTVQMVLVLAGIALLAWKKNRRIVRALALANVALPLGMLILPPIAPGNDFGAALLLGFFTGIVSGMAFRPRFGEDGVRKLFHALCALLVLVILLDLLTGSRLLRQAWMSYSVMEGARFYGIGNEYMGAVIGALCVLISSGAQAVGNDLRRVPASLVLAFVLLIVMGLPSMGAKVGAIPSAGAAFGMEVLVLWRQRLRMQDALLVLVVIALLLGAFAGWDLRHAAGEQSHFGRALSGGGGDSLFGIARRKLLLEFALLLHSPWSATLIAGAGGLIWRLRTCAAGFSNAAARNTRAVVAGLTAGALASLLCNDSGVTAAALVLVYGWAWAVLEVAP